ncbi:MAG: hypothetical protein K0V04_43120 [Deltaproteobacteria bacterium]|nr:hypothetical protein [Deltaproteobacteria bacterium]
MTSITPVRDPVPEAIAALLDLFDAHAEALCFPETDHATLAALADASRHSASDVERCEQALADARRVFDDSCEALRLRATRGLAYARIYAEDDPSLRERLDAIELPVRRKASPKRTKKPPRRVPRSRRVKAGEADASVTELPFAESSSEPAAHAGVA